MNGTDVEMDQIVTLAEGNPGATTVLGQLLRDRPDKAEPVVEQLEEMNMGGPRIWLGYKDHCGQDIDEFITAVLNRDQEMIDFINERSMSGDPTVS